MKNYLIRNPLPTLVAVLLAIPLWAGSRDAGTASSKTFTGEITDTICAPSGSHAAMMAKMPSMGGDSANCTKKCAELGAKYALVDASTKQVYILDGSPKVQAMAGKRVRVTGTVEGNKINVTNVDSSA